jgi:ribose-phosphate pyrophosphokinase
MENVRGHDVFIVQSTCPPTSDNLMELLLMADACRRASAERMTAVIPYFGYARQDRRPRAQRVAISAKLVANLIASSAGCIACSRSDLHAEQIQGFFDIPVDNVYASPVLLGEAWKQHYDRMVVVSPDVGGVVRARALAKRLDDADLAIIDKRRPTRNEIAGDAHHRRREGQDLRDGRRHDRYRRDHRAGGRGAEGGWRHARSSPTSRIPCSPARRVERISKSQLDELVVTDTIPLRPDGRACRKIRQLSVAGLLGESMRRISDEESVTPVTID